METHKDSLWEILGPGNKPHLVFARCGGTCGGKIKEVNKYQIKSGRTICCGCATRNHNAVKHGGQKTPEYAIWAAMKARCKNANNPRHIHYGERGITVCARWNSADGFVAFLEDMERRPDPELSLHRVDNDKGYWCGKPECPECGPIGREKNCAWATEEEQMAERQNSVKIFYNGDTKTRKAWCKILKLNPNTIKYRMEQGLTFEEAIAKPKSKFMVSRKTGELKKPN